MITTKAEALAAAGPRYAPVGILADRGLDGGTHDHREAVEISAIRALSASKSPTEAR